MTELSSKHKKEETSVVAAPTAQVNVRKNIKIKSNKDEEEAKKEGEKRVKKSMDLVRNISNAHY